MNARKHNRTPASQQPTAAETYATRRNDIARLMDVLQMELDKHAEAAKADPKNWGRTGDLGKVRSDLIDLVGFMSGMDREHVEAFLNDAE
ncbi:MAG: hypothetical protein J0L78_09715 [Planctomycetes bacterium]|nr:hypothetical protein [Phycisphaerales bacterium]MBN8597938.1 hypothetical protein [Planctomycetota bacterium]